VNTASWIIVADDEPVGGVVGLAASMGAPVTIIAVGPRARADAAATAGPDRVLWIALPEGAPEESMAPAVASLVAAAAPCLMLAGEAPASRAILGAAAGRVGAAIISSIRAVSVEDGRLVATHSAIEGKVIETIAVEGTLAGIFDGESRDVDGARPAPVEEISPDAIDDGLRIVEVRPGTGGDSGLRAAARVVGAGLGIRAKADLALVDDLAAAARAEIACSLPVCDDMRWYDSEHVLGRSHHTIKPDLYIAVGISGQPQHMSGVRDAKVVVAINSDPNAPIFKSCDYGVVGDLYDVVPALVAALR
jgi:electron transfer flavoprotein alpha subunit